VRAQAALDGDPLSPGIGLPRITCDLPDAPLDTVVEFRRRRHRASTNPRWSTSPRATPRASRCPRAAPACASSRA